MTELVQDINKVREILTELQNDNKIKFCEVESVKVRNPVSKVQQMARNLFFVSTGRNSNKPLFVVAIKFRDNKIYLAHRDFTHWNMNPDCSNYYVGDITIIYRSFCNPVLQSHIWENPDRASKILKGNLMEGNPNDRYRTPDSVDLLWRARYLTDVNGNIIKRSVGLDMFYLGTTIDNVDVDRARAYINICKKLEADHELVFGYVAMANTIDLDFFKQLVKKSDITSGKYIASEYYKLYSFKDVGNITEIPKREYSIACAGCGSAGTGILDQVIRLNYFDGKPMVLIDFDKVEDKNLRNQFYRRVHRGKDKTYSARDILQSIRPLTIEAFYGKYEDYSWSLGKYDYVISGFDSIECRLGLLDKVISGEIETKYLIDARYDGLESSLFMVDTSNESEMKYYEKLLKQDLEEFKAVPQQLDSNEWTIESVEKYGNDTELFARNCSQIASMVGGREENICWQIEGHYLDCNSSRCKECVLKYFQKHNFPMDRKYAVQTTCVSENLIHIYKLTSAWVVSNIRAIESGEGKQFTHVDITVDPIPNAIVMRK